MAAEAWFYTRGGERFGPVTFGDLQSAATGGQLNPRLDMAWSPAMDAWKATGEIEGLFERRTVEKTPERVENRCQALGETAAQEATASKPEWPGATRGRFYIGIFLVPFLLHFGRELIREPLQIEPGTNLNSMLVIGVGILHLGLLVYYLIQRLANLGMSRWWFLGLFLPVLNWWLGFRCFCCPRGYAKYKKFDGIGLVLAIVYWLTQAFFTLLIVATAAMLLGKLGTPEAQQRLRETYRKDIEQIRTLTGEPAGK